MVDQNRVSWNQLIQWLRRLQVMFHHRVCTG